jgi:hypothetical protein
VIHKFYLEADGDPSASFRLGGAMDFRLNSSSESKLDETLIANFDAARLARLIADGQIDLPVELSTDQLNLVIPLVRERRRQHLVRHIAHCIAYDIQATANTKDRDSKHD